MARWTKEGWANLEHIADSTFVFTSFPSSGIKVMQEAQITCALIENSNGPWKQVNNIFNQVRYWHPFHNGKILVWKADEIGPIFVGAFYSMPDPLYV